MFTMITNVIKGKDLKSVTLKNKNIRNKNSKFTKTIQGNKPVLISREKKTRVSNSVNKIIWVGKRGELLIKI